MCTGNDNHPLESVQPVLNFKHALKFSTRTQEKHWDTSHQSGVLFTFGTMPFSHTLFIVFGIFVSSSLQFEIKPSLTLVSSMVKTGTKD